jgi:hypothetical protein
LIVVRLPVVTTHSRIRQLNVSVDLRTQSYGLFDKRKVESRHKRVLDLP